MKDDLAFARLWDLYSPLLTERQRSIAHLYFNYDLSLGEIAEQLGVSRQSVYDCLQTCKKTLEETEEKLGFLKTLERRTETFALYRQRVGNYCAQAVETGAARQEIDEALARLERETFTDGV